MDTAPSATATGPRCPFASFGLSAAELTSCPGYLATEIEFEGLRLPGDYAGRPRLRGVSCGHLGVSPSRRGFRAGCHHPDGLPTRWPGFGRDPVASAIVTRALSSKV